MSEQEQFIYTIDSGRPIDPEVQREIFLICLGLSSLTRALELVSSFKGEGEVVKNMTLEVLRASRASTRAILKDD